MVGFGLGLGLVAGLDVAAVVLIVVGKVVVLADAVEKSNAKKLHVRVGCATLQSRVCDPKPTTHAAFA